MTQVRCPDPWAQESIWLSHTPYPAATLHADTDLTPLHTGPDYVLLQGTPRAAEDWADDTLSTPPERPRPGMYGAGTRALFVTAHGHLALSAQNVLSSLHLPCEPTEAAAVARLHAAGLTYP